MNTLELVNAAIAGDREGATKAFNDVMGLKVTDALELKKVEVASNLITTQEAEQEQNETEELQAEVSGGSEDEQSAAAE